MLRKYDSNPIIEIAISLNWARPNCLSATPQYHNNNTPPPPPPSRNTYIRHQTVKTNNISNITQRFHDQSGDIIGTNQPRILAAGGGLVNHRGPCVTDITWWIYRAIPLHWWADTLSKLHSPLTDCTSLPFFPPKSDADGQIYSSAPFDTFTSVFISPIDSAEASVKPVMFVGWVLAGFISYTFMYEENIPTVYS